LLENGTNSSAFETVIARLVEAIFVAGSIAVIVTVYVPGTVKRAVALVPLGENGALGLLALGSAERERFHPGMSTEFLKRMGELITDALARP